MAEEPILYKNRQVINAQETAAQGRVTQHSIPSWNTAGRPEKAKEGTIGFNIRTKTLEIRSGRRWLKLKMKPVREN